MINDSLLVVVDMLYDFIDGSLACLGADKAVANTLQFIKNTRNDDLPVFFIRDHHPADHSSFREQGGHSTRAATRPWSSIPASTDATPPASHSAR